MVQLYHPNEALTDILARKQPKVDKLNHLQGNREEKIIEKANHSFN
jgi:hypothetical protein